MSRVSGQSRRVTLFVGGDVQGVGFRWWTRARALELGLVGYARNLDDGRVEVCAQGEGEDVTRFEALLSEPSSTSRRPGRVDSVVSRPGAVREDLVGFDAY
ncbi:MAG TPA: acylphosphatase [Dermatophilaceae bacterium]|nr:acylphosphatase [Dermatophilaceae bacterium]